MKDEIEMKHLRFLNLTRLVILVICASMLFCACVQNGGDSTEETTVALDETTKSEDNSTTSEDSTTVSENDTTKTEEDTSDIMNTNKITDDVNERYFIFRIWNFTVTSYQVFTSTVDEAVKSGFNAIKVHIPWALVQPDADTMNFSEFDKMINYVVNEKGLKVAISVDLTRRSADSLVGEKYIQRDVNGNLCVGGAHGNNRTVISFCSDYAVDLAIDFYKATVEHYEQLCGDKVLFYLPSFNPYCETEYWAAGEYDYSDIALAAFAEFLKAEYGTIEKLNAILGTSYTNFKEVIPPACNSSGGVGTLWYRFRHQNLKAFIDGLAAAQKSVAPDSKFAVQFGSVSDDASAARGTLAFTDLCENANVIWVDDGPITDHYWSMDYIRAAFNGKVELAQEIDGPHQTHASPEKYLDQGLTAFERGATYVSAANWSIDTYYRDYEHVWKQIASTWLAEDHPDVVVSSEDTQILEVSLLDRFKAGNSNSDVSRYYELSGTDHKLVYIKIIDDLSNVAADSILPSAKFPNDFSSTQGQGGWYYRSYKGGTFYDMTFLDGRWNGEAQYTLIMNGSVHPDTYDAALVYKAVKTGEVKLSYNLSLMDEASDGIRYTILVNGEPAAEIGNSMLYLPYGEEASGALVLSVEKGDEIALIVNKHKKTTGDTTKVVLSVEYQS